MKPGALILAAGAAMAAHAGMTAEVDVLGAVVPEALRALPDVRLVRPGDSPEPMARVIYLDDPAALAGLKGLPPDRLVVVNDCDWSRPFADLPRDLRARVASPTGACDGAEVARRAASALAAAPARQADELRQAGFQIHALAQNAARPVLDTSIVISALPGDAVIVAAEAPQAVVLPAALAPAPAAQAPRRADLPQPSIIVGELASLIGQDQRGPLGVPYAIRQRIRLLDPALFQTMLAGGAFDPLADQMATALQTELQRMNCYGGTVDGSWGQGSIAALGRYFSTLGAANAATAPDPALFRTLAQNPDVECPQLAPAVAATPAVPRAGTAATVQRTPSARQPRQPSTVATSARRQPAPAAAPAQPAAPATTRWNMNPRGSGMYR